MFGRTFLEKTTNPHNLKICLLLFVFNLLRSFGAMSPAMSLDENFLLVSEDLEETSIDTTLEGWVALSKRPGGKGKKLTYGRLPALQD
jgi:hypothetical protein